MSVTSPQPARQLPLALDLRSLKGPFPDTKYMGSKQTLLPFILRHVAALRFRRALDVFWARAALRTP